jgi:hypothetical protein
MASPKKLAIFLSFAVIKSAFCSSWSGSQILKIGGPVTRIKKPGQTRVTSGQD